MLLLWVGTGKPILKDKFSQLLHKRFAGVGCVAMLEIYAGKTIMNADGEFRGREGGYSSLPCNLNWILNWYNNDALKTSIHFNGYPNRITWKYGDTL